MKCTNNWFGLVMWIGIQMEDWQIKFLVGPQLESYLEGINSATGDSRDNISMAHFYGMIIGKDMATGRQQL